MGASVLGGLDTNSSGYHSDSSDTPVRTGLQLLLFLFALSPFGFHSLALPHRQQQEQGLVPGGEPSVP